jgi:alpha-L-fucosidase|tara:strand:+ start:4679 stop:4981 length:303 start_codon:yes stop_codon:yes gene_type:complete
MASYNKTSPWFNTVITPGGELDVLKIRPVPAEDDDLLYEIESQYTHRPDLLAFDLYGTSKLWWVFAQRNMNVIKDPIYDMEPGIKIFVPKSSALKRTLQL